MSKPTPSLSCVIDRLEGSKVVILFRFGNNNCQQLIIPRNLLPKDIKEGTVLSMEFLTEKQATVRQKNLAREILREILNGK